MDQLQSPVLILGIGGTLEGCEGLNRKRNMRPVARACHRTEFHSAVGQPHHVTATFPEERVHSTNLDWGRLWARGTSALAGRKSISNRHIQTPRCAES